MTPEEALAAALPRAVNFRIPVALPVRSEMWRVIAAETLENLDGYSIVPTAELDRLRAVDVGYLRAAMHVVLSGNKDAARFVLGETPPDYIAERIVIEYAALGDRAAEEGRPVAGLLYEARLALHYAEDHGSVSPGDLVAKCTDGLCPRLLAAEERR